MSDYRNDGNVLGESTNRSQQHPSPMKLPRSGTKKRTGFSALLQRVKEGNRSPKAKGREKHEIQLSVWEKGQKGQDQQGRGEAQESG
jgi:hypothetical protein